VTLHHPGRRVPQTAVVTDLNAAYVAAGAALGASALTVFAAYGMERLREKRAASGARTAKKLAIYQELLSSSAGIVRAFVKLRLTSDTTSKAFYGLNQMLKKAPEQPTFMEIVGILDEPIGRLMDAWSQALLMLDQDEIDAVNRLVNAAQSFDLSVPPTENHSAEALIGAARREFAEFARVKLGESAARVGLETARPDQS
jgi:hypothetical protein